jgi:hypothetical protein
MAAPESTKFQVNFKAPDGTLVNLYAANKEELEALLTAAQDFSPLIASVSQSISGARAATPVSGGQLHSSPEIADQTRPASGNSCRHGAMSYREGVGAKGPWKGYMCAAPKGATDKCATIWVK